MNLDCSLAVGFTTCTLAKRQNEVLKSIKRTASKKTVTSCSCVLLAVAVAVFLLAVLLMDFKNLILSFKDQNILCMPLSK